MLKGKSKEMCACRRVQLKRVKTIPSLTNGQVVNVDLLDLLHNLLHVRLRQLFHRCFWQQVGQVDVVAAVPGLPHFSGKESQALLEFGLTENQLQYEDREFLLHVSQNIHRIRSQDGNALQVPHILLAGLALQPLKEEHLLPHQG